MKRTKNIILPPLLNKSAPNTEAGFHVLVDNNRGVPVDNRSVCSLEGVDCVHPTASLAKGQREITRESGKVP